MQMANKEQACQRGPGEWEEGRCVRWCRVTKSNRDDEENMQIRAVLILEKIKIAKCFQERKLFELLVLVICRLSILYLILILYFE